MQPTGTREEQQHDDEPVEFLDLIADQERALQAAVLPRSASFAGYFDALELVREVLNPTEGTDR